ncbi:hypothetical protein FOL46_003084 [Perkinsus olseni]|uniref:Mei2-like C-terminal RNA recognition motif domain-containing protein n=1 Tax=Perkinsus olseni TaxID=32597 RepID=A0A7J6M4L6_PEROL|nr:hypothetical protein FOL46_003084 [Perkinsus olseni]
MVEAGTSQSSGMQRNVSLRNTFLHFHCSQPDFTKVRSYDDVDAALSERRGVTVPIQRGGSFAQMVPLKDKLRNIKKELLGLSPDSDGFTRALSFSRLSLTQSKSAAQLHRGSEYSVNSMLNRCFHPSATPPLAEPEFECCGNCGTPNDGSEFREGGMWRCLVCGYLNGAGPGVIGAGSILDRCIEEVTQDAHTDVATVHSSPLGDPQVFVEVMGDGGVEEDSRRRTISIPFEGIELPEKTRRRKKKRSRKKSKDEKTSEGERVIRHRLAVHAAAADGLSSDLNADHGDQPRAASAKEREPSPHPDGPITTLMLRNIPNKYTQPMLRGVLDECFMHKYDFLYLPIDFKNRCNIGYAFINFLDEDVAHQFREKFQGLHLPGFNSTKVCDVSVARVQGLYANVEHYKNSPVCALPAQEYRPIILGCDPRKPDEMGEVLPFPQPDVTPQAIKLRGSRARAAHRMAMAHQQQQQQQ